tara:strand:- start:1816 stop:2079 length:264 start_codon:yes stop_codon:yes gene_type:complete
MKILPPNYGEYVEHGMVRKGHLNGGLLDTITKVQTTVDNFEQQSVKLEQTQKQIQFLTSMGIIVLGLGGSFLFYRFLKTVNTKGKKK